MALVLGLDLGTSAVKALVINEQGKIMASASKSYPLIQPRTDWSEQDPETWWDGVLNVVNKILSLDDIEGKSIRALALSGQMHGSVFLDEKGQVIRFPLLWKWTGTMSNRKSLGVLIIVL